MGMRGRNGGTARDRAKNRWGKHHVRFEQPEAEEPMAIPESEIDAIVDLAHAIRTGSSRQMPNDIPLKRQPFVWAKAHERAKISMSNKGQ